MRRYSPLFLVLLLLLAACQTVQVPITHMRAAEGAIPGDVKQIAIMPYDYDVQPDGSGDYSYLRNRIPDQVAAKITSWGTYGVVERQKLQNLVKEHMLQKGSTLSDEEIEEVGRIAEAQAIVLGRVANVRVEEEMQPRQYQIEPGPQKDPDAPPPQPQTVTYNYLVRRVSVNVTSEMLHVANKNKIITDAFSYTYDSEQDAKVKQPHGFLTAKDADYYREQPGRVPSVSKIIDDIAQNCADQFLRKISAHPVHFRIALKAGSSAPMEQGMEWAKQGQYQSAITEFQKATGIPEDKASAYFNMGVCYEALKRYEEAVQAYTQSDGFAPSSDAKSGISRIRRYNPSL